MNLQLLHPRKALNKAFLKVRPIRSDIEIFKENLIHLLNQVHELETEEFHKNTVSRFLQSTYYTPNHYINTKGYNDLVIHNGKDAYSKVGVILEAKKPMNKAEMLKKENVNTKAFQELLLYYLRERISGNNHELKHLIVTNIYEWFIFDVSVFERTFAQNKRLVQQFVDFEEGRLGGKKTEYFYKEIAEPAIANIQIETTFTYFDLRDYEKALRNEDNKDDNKLIILYKILSPEHLLKLPFANDSNNLDKAFYTELLHIIGLTEIKEGGKKLIERKKNGDRNPGSFMENAIIQLDSLDKISRLSSPSHYGSTQEERLFNVGLELVITWINRILFLKLLEGQLITYHSKRKGSRSEDKAFSFLNLHKIQNYDDLNSLFFQVLARRPEERSAEVQSIFRNVPYLNSSLFEPTEIEHSAIFISNLRDERKLPILGATVLKNSEGKKRTGELNALEYLFEFLNSYDFSSEGSEEIQEDNKTLINASVLGLIFEKINGYKDGSFFTPGFITMYMCREAIRKTVLQKFKDVKGWDCVDLDSLYNKLGEKKEDKQEANEIINSIKICDPAVGSGHFLVSALNEIIAIKHDLKILLDRNGKRLKEYHVEVVNDELVITDEDGKLFEYNFHNPESQRVQETLFHEKQTIIENCLFGVDINPNSVKICRLRLWIELLKNAYYIDAKVVNSLDRQLETLPNIDINIKCGNSLISRFPLDSDLRQALKKSKWKIDSYKIAVQTYRNAVNKEEKRGMEKLINDIKSDFRTEINSNDPRKKKLSKLGGELYNITQNQLFTPSKAELKLNKQKKEKLEKEIASLSSEIEEIKSNKMYENAFEWRFEFPEVLNDEGDYIGFDAMIGNPPYIQLQKMGQDSIDLQKVGYETYESTGDIYSLFYELGYRQLKTSGVLSFITSNKWMRAGYGESTRRFFAERTNPLLLIDFAGQKIFESATVDVNILMFSRDKNRQETKACVVTKDVLNNLSDFVRQKAARTSFLHSDSWVILSDIEQRIKAKIESAGTPLKDWDIKIYRGILTGYNEAFIISGQKKQEILDNCATADEKEKTDQLIRPILRGRDIRRYGHNFADLWLINTHNGIKEKGINPIKIEDYPSIKQHLDGFHSELIRRTDKGETPYNLRNCAYMDDFSKQKIVWGNLNLERSYAIAPPGYFVNAPCPMIVPANKYLLAVLNSKLADHYIRKLGVTRSGGYFEYKPMFIEKMPIPNISDTQQNQIANLLQEVTNGDLEKRIDKEIYKLYDLSVEEINFIESE